MGNTFKVTSKLKCKGKTVGYGVVIEEQGNTIFRNISKQKLRQFCQIATLSNAKYNPKTNSLQGINGVDLRKIKSINLAQLDEADGMAPQKAQQAMRYKKKMRLLNKEPQFEFRIVDDNTVLLVNVLDKDSTGKIVIPQFITGLDEKKQDQSYDLLEQAFTGCRFTEIEIQNSPGTFKTIDKMCCRMRQSSIKLTMWHDEDVKSAKELFQGCRNLQKIDLSGLTLDNLEIASKIFEQCVNIVELDLQTIVFSKTTRMDGLCLLCEQLETVKFGNHKYKQSSLIDISLMFYKCYKLKNIEFGSLTFKNVKHADAMFAHCQCLEDIDTDRLRFYKIERLEQAFLDCRQLKSLDLQTQYLGNLHSASKILKDQSSIEQFKTQSTMFNKLMNASQMLDNCMQLSDFTIIKDPRKPDKYGENIRSTENMFKGCSSLEIVDLSEFYFYSLEIAVSMFECCTGLKTIVAPKYDAGNIRTCENMFDCCSKLKRLDLRWIKQLKLENVSAMFNDMEELETTIWPDITYNKVQWMNYMYAGCKKIKEIDLKQFTGDRLLSLHRAFISCYCLQRVDLSGIQTVKIIYDYERGLGLYTEYMVDDGTTVKLQGDKQIVDRQRQGKTRVRDREYFNEQHRVLAQEMFDGCEELTKDGIIGYKTMKLVLDRSKRDE